MKKKSKHGGAREGAGRPRKPPVAPPISFRLPRDVHAELEADALAAGVPVNGLAKAWVVAELDNRRLKRGAG